MRPTLVLIESHSSVLSSMERPLIEADFRVRLVDDGHAAIKAVEEDRPAAVVVGRLSDHLSRLEFCELLRRVAPVAHTAIIVVLSRDSEIMRVRCLEAGADDCIVEPFQETALLLRIRSILRRSRPIEPAPQWLAHAGLSIDIEQFKVYYQGRRIALRPKELRLLKIFLEHPETILSRSDICGLADWRSKRESGRLVDSQVKLLRQAFRSSGVPNVIRTIRASGYLLSAEATNKTATSPRTVAERQRWYQRDA